MPSKLVGLVNRFSLLMSLAFNMSIRSQRNRFAARACAEAKQLCNQKRIDEQ